MNTITITDDKGNSKTVPYVETCQRFRRLYWDWIGAIGTKREEAAFRKYKAHYEVCNCRGIGGEWTPLEEE